MWAVLYVSDFKEGNIGEEVSLFYSILFGSRSQALSGILHLCLLVRLSPKGFQPQPGATSQIHLHQRAKARIVWKK